jgi:hypothetical protein
VLITLLGLIALFVVARNLVLRYSAKPILSTAAAGTIICAFLAGFAVRPLVFPQPILTSTPMSAPAAPGSGGTAVSPANRTLSGTQLSRLTPAGPPVAYSVIESIGGDGPNADQFPAGATITVSGWAGDPATRSTAAGLLFLVDGGKRRFDATMGYGGDRTDVAQAFQSPAMLRTGFNASFPTSGLATGKHALELGVIRKDGRHYQVVSQPKVFTIK